MNAYESEALPLRKARIEIIPLIDVIFFLLATFVLFTLSLQRMRVVDAVFPSGDITPSKGEADTVFIQASAEGTYYWQRGSDSAAEAITAPELGPRLEEYRRGSSNPRVLVRSDGRAKLGDAVRVLEAVRRAGISQVAVETHTSRPGG
jgi:biopolymer transport protein ExbD